MTRTTIWAWTALCLAVFVAYFLFRDDESSLSSTVGGPRGVEPGVVGASDTDLVSNSVVHEPPADLSRQPRDASDIYDQEFLELIRVEAGLNTEGQARQFSKTLDKISEITGRDQRSVLFDLRMRETQLVPAGAKANLFFREHVDNVDPTATGLEGRMINEIWRYSGYLDAVPAFVDVECLVSVCRASVEFPNGYEDALSGVTFGVVKMALQVELEDHGIIRVSEGPADPSSEMRYVYLWRQEGSRPEWEAYLPVFPEAVKAMIAEGLNRQQSAE